MNKSTVLAGFGWLFFILGVLAWLVFHDDTAAIVAFIFSAEAAIRADIRSVPRVSIKTDDGVSISQVDDSNA